MLIMQCVTLSLCIFHLNLTLMFIIQGLVKLVLTLKYSWFPYRQTSIIKIFIIQQQVEELKSQHQCNLVHVKWPHFFALFQHIFTCQCSCFVQDVYQKIIQIVFLSLLQCIFILCHILKIFFTKINDIHLFKLMECINIRANYTILPLGLVK